jgi:hypothetical protein
MIQIKLYARCGGVGSGNAGVGVHIMFAIACPPLSLLLVLFTKMAWRGSEHRPCARYYIQPVLYSSRHDECSSVPATSAPTSRPVLWEYSRQAVTVVDKCLALASVYRPRDNLISVERQRRAPPLPHCYYSRVPVVIVGFSLQRLMLTTLSHTQRLLHTLLTHSPFHFLHIAITPAPTTYFY